MRHVELHGIRFRGLAMAVLLAGVVSPLRGDDLEKELPKRPEPKPPSLRLGVSRVDREHELGVVSRTAVSPDGRILATGDAWDSPVQLYDTLDWRRIGALIGAGQPSAFSGDGRFLLTHRYQYPQVRAIALLWQLQPFQPQPVWTGTIEGEPKDVAMSADADVIAMLISATATPGVPSPSPTIGKNEVVVWERRAEKLHRLPQTGWLSAVTVSPNGQWIAYGVNHYPGQLLRIWDVAKQQQRFEFQLGSVHGLAASPDGKRLAAAIVDGTRVWDVSSGEVVKQFSGKAEHHVVFTPDGQELFTAGWDRLAWQSLDGSLLRAIAGSTARPAIGGDLLAIPLQNRGVTLYRWPDLEPLQPTSSPQGHSGPQGLVPWVVRQLVPLGDGSAATFGEDNYVIVWDLETGQARRRYALAPSARELASLSAAGNGWVYVKDDTLTVGDVVTGKTRRTRKHFAKISAVAMSPSGRLVAFYDANRNLMIWDVVKDEFPAFADVEKIGRYLRFRSEDVLEVAAFGNCSAAWDVAGLKPRPGDVRYVNQASPIKDVVRSPEGHWTLSVYQPLTSPLRKPSKDDDDRRRNEGPRPDDPIYLHVADRHGNARQWRLPFRFVRTMAISPDATRVAISGHLWQTYPRTSFTAVVVYELASGRLEEWYELPQDDAYNLAFLPDNKTLLGAGRAIVAWRLGDKTTGAEKTTFFRPPEPIVAPPRESWMDLWTALDSSDAWAARAAIWKLAAAGEPIVPFLTERRKPAIAPAKPGESLGPAERQAMRAAEVVRRVSKRQS